MAKFGTKSIARQATCHYILQDLANRVIKYYDIAIIEGHRPEIEQNEAYTNNVSTKRWPDSKHNSLPSMAIDVVPWPVPDDWGALNGISYARDLQWKERVKFYEMTAVFKFCWAQMCEEYGEIAESYVLRFGADWDGDGDYRDQSFDDLPHIELVIL